MIKIMNQRYFSVFSACCFGLALFGTGIPGRAAEFDPFKVISIEGEDVPKALSLDIQALSLAAIIDGTMEPIPFQIDEYNEGGAVYFEGWDVPLQGELGVFDERDRLLFLNKDAGPRLNKQLHDGQIVAEIELSEPNQPKRFVYLMKDSRLRSDENYVRYSAEQGLVETDFYSVNYDQKNHLVWKDFEVFSYQKKAPFDEMKIRWSSGLLTASTRVMLTNEDIVAEPRGVRVGPIRNTTQLLVTLYIAEVPALTASLQLHHYPRSVIYDMRVVTPEFRRAMLVEPKLALSLDGNELFGAYVRTAAGPKQMSIVDGNVNSVEQAMIAAGVKRVNNWMWTSTQKGLDVLAFFDFMGDTDEPVSLVYEDDINKHEDTERYKGQLPNFGYQIDHFPEKGLFGFAVSLYVSDGFTGEPEDFSLATRSMPDIRVY